MAVSTAILRGVSGAYMLQSGFAKRNLPTEAADGLKQFAATGMPRLQKLNSDTFGKLVAVSEMGIGAALVSPFVNSRVAGLALGTFSAGLLSIYFRNQDMTQPDGIRPSDEGTSLSKDAFLAAIAGALITAPNPKD